jgi:hypothetical protein
LNKGLSDEEFRDRYLARLDLHKTELLNQLLGIDNEQRPGRKPLRLLCFEDITQEGVWCHRTLFAEWWHLTFPDLGRVEEMG